MELEDFKRLLKDPCLHGRRGNTTYTSVSLESEWFNYRLTHHADREVEDELLYPLFHAEVNSLAPAVKIAQRLYNSACTEIAIVESIPTLKFTSPFEHLYSRSGIGENTPDLEGHIFNYSGTFEVKDYISQKSFRKWRWTSKNIYHGTDYLLVHVMGEKGLYITEPDSDILAPLPVEIDYRLMQVHLSEESGELKVRAWQ